MRSRRRALGHAGIGLAIGVVIGAALGVGLGAAIGTWTGNLGRWIGNCTAILASIGANLGMAIGFARSRRGPEECPNCGYQTRGLPTSVCPECGVDYEAVRREEATHPEGTAPAPVESSARIAPGRRPPAPASRCDLRRSPSGPAGPVDPLG